MRQSVFLPSIQSKAAFGEEVNEARFKQSDVVDIT